MNLANESVLVVAARPLGRVSPIEVRRQRDARRIPSKPVPDPPFEEESDFYSPRGVFRCSEDDEIDGAEEGFMAGYLSA